MDAPLPPQLPSLPPPDAIKHLAQEILHRSVYDLGPTDDVPALLRAIRFLRKTFGPAFGWLQALFEYSPVLGGLVFALLVGILIGLIWHIIWSFRSALRAPDEIRPGLAGPVHQTSAEIEQLARAAGKKGQFIEAVRLLFMASLMTLEAAQKRNVRRGTTNREYLKRFKDTPAFDPLFFLVETVDRKWYAGIPCTEADYQESLRAYATIQQAARAQAAPAAVTKETPRA